jgi:O-antigen/teichoic acid export membrane protein
MVAVGILLPLLMVQDVIRYHWLAQRRAWRAGVTDLVWLVVSLIAYPIAIVKGYGTTGMAFSWALGGAASALVDLAVLRLPLALRGHIGFVKQNWDLSRHQMIEAVLQYGSSVASVAMLGVVANLNAVGQIRLGQTLLGPLRTLLLGVAMAEVPETVHIARRSTLLLRRRIRSLGLMLAALVMVAGVVIQLIPGGFGSVLLGQNWHAAQQVAVPLVFGFVSVAFMFGPLVGLRALERAAVVVRCSVVQVVLSTVGFVVGALIGDAIGAAVGQSIGLILSATVWWRAWTQNAKAYVPASVESRTPDGEELLIEELGTVGSD